MLPEAVNGGIQARHGEVGYSEPAASTSVFWPESSPRSSQAQSAEPAAAAQPRTSFRGNPRRVASCARWWRNDVLLLSLCGNIQPDDTEAMFNDGKSSAQ